MSLVLDDILRTYFQSLLLSEEFDVVRVERLKMLFDESDKPKPADIVDILSNDQDDIAE